MKLSDFDGVFLMKWSSRPGDTPLVTRKLETNLDGDNILWLDDNSGTNFAHGEYFAYARFPDKTVLVYREEPC